MWTTRAVSMPASPLLLGSFRSAVVSVMAGTMGISVVESAESA